MCFSQSCTVFTELVALTVLLKVTYFFGDWVFGMNNDVNLMMMAPADSVSGNAISSMGISAPPPVENTPVPVSQPSPRIYQETAHVSVNTLPEFNSVSALYFIIVSPYAGVRHMLEAELKERLTVYQVATPKYHQEL